MLEQLERLRRGKDGRACPATPTRSPRSAESGSPTSAYRPTTSWSSTGTPSRTGCSDPALPGHRRHRAAAALYSPPIDPALLVQAVAAGVDIDQAVAQAGGPVPAYRFTLLAQKATELCAEVKGLGAEILSLLEKKDAEQLARLRSGQEIALLELVEQVRTNQVNEANAGIEALKASREVAASRYRHVQSLLTGQPGKEPAQGSLITEAPSTLALASPQPVEPDVRGLGLLQTEQDQFVQLRESRQRTQEAAITNILASVFFLIGSYPTTSFVQGPAMP